MRPLLTLTVLALFIAAPVHAQESNLKLEETDDYLLIDTDVLQAKVRKKGYVSGIAAGSLLDRKTGAKDLGFGLHIMDFLLGPGWKDDSYTREPKFHGNLPKHYIEGPQICTQAKKLDPEIIRGQDFIAVKLKFRFTQGHNGFKAGSAWEQTLVFQPGKRWVLCGETITSANNVPNLLYRIDMPGHVKHKRGDTFSQVHLSYRGTFSSQEFLNDFAPDARFLYQRSAGRVPERMIRAYQVKLDGAAAGKTTQGPWLAGMTLAPGLVAEAWCHQRSYICFIEELHGRPVKAGQTIGAAYIVGYFDDIPEMNRTYDLYKGIRRVTADMKGIHTSKE